jgi:hypothetical protein
VGTQVRNELGECAIDCVAELITRNYLPHELDE